MDSFIYALVLVPAMREVLPASGIQPTAGNLGYYGSILFSVFLIGWGCAFLWGPVADRFGRVRTLVLAILCYSLFTFLGSLAQNIWQLGVFRLLAGFGIGGEIGGAATFVAEEMPDDRRVFRAGLLNSGYYAGTFLAGALNYWIGAHYGWRAMFAAGGTPALLVAFIRWGVREPERWQRRMADIGKWGARDSLSALFSPEYRQRTLVNCLLLLISMIGLWAGSVYAPGAVTQVAMREGYSAAESARFASWATMLLSFGTILGCLFMSRLAHKFGRRGAVAWFYAIMAASIAVSFGYAFYLPRNALALFIPCLFFVGVGGGSFSVFLAWLPEQYRTECRGSAIALVLSLGRFVAAGATFLVGAGISAYGSIGMPVAATSLAFALGLIVVPFATETRGEPLPL
jgi:MFS family permease